MNCPAPVQQQREPSFLETHSLMVQPSASAQELCDHQEKLLTALWDAGMLQGQGGC